MAEVLKQVSLRQKHINAGAQLVPFGGWEMPVRYKGGGDIAEHNAARQGVVLFDVSHMGRVEFLGTQSLPFLDYITINNVNALEPDQAQYSAMCYENGGIVDDVLVYRGDFRRMSLVINAGNRDKDLDWIRHHATKFRVDVLDVSNETVLLALQGPRAQDALFKLTRLDLNSLQPFHFINTVVDGQRMRVSRTGYTGEDGFELWFAKEKAEKVWDDLLGAGQEFGILPAGLGARDSLRLEAGLCLYGHEIDENTNPYEANLGWITKIKEKEDFIGKEALVQIQQEGLSKRLAGFRTSGRRDIPRQHYLVYSDYQRVGNIVSGVFSPTFEVGIGTGFIPPELAKTGNMVEIRTEDGGRSFAAEVLVPPRFYRRKAA